MLRKYTQAKITENTTAEIMQVILLETLESYAPEIVVELRSDGVDDGELEDNVRRIEKWVEEWKRNGGGEAQSRDVEHEEDKEEEGDGMQA
jgi:adenylate kinase